MKYFSRNKKWVAYLMLLVFVFTSIMPTGTVFAAPGATDGQIENRGGTVYYDASGILVDAAALGENDAVVKMSKTVADTGTENVFGITLNVATSESNEEIEIVRDAAVVLVVDLSNTMENSCLIHGYQCHSSGGTCKNTTRLKAAIETAQDFIDEYSKNVPNGQKREVAIVGFSLNGEVFYDWTDVSQPGNATLVKNSIGNWTNYTKNAGWKLTKFRAGTTNMESGLQLAKDLLEKKDNNYYKYCVLLSDGSPTAHVDKNDSNSVKGSHYYGCRLKECTKDKCETNGTSSGSDVNTPDYQRAGAVAKEIKNLSNTKLYVIALAGGTWLYNATGNKLLDGKQPGPWLAETVASPKEGEREYLLMGDSKGEIEDAYEDIVDLVETQTQYTYTKPLRVVDPMGDMVALIGTPEVSIGNAAVSNDIITWTMNPEAAGSFTMTYQVRLKNEANGFISERPYVTNDTTTLDFKEVENGTPQTESEVVEFPIPAVKGYLGTLSFTKTDGTNPLADATFTLTHNTNCNVCGGTVTIASMSATSAVDDPDTTDINELGMVTFSNIPSGHEYTLTETVVPEGYIGVSKSYPVNVNYGVVQIEDKDASFNGTTFVNVPETTTVTVTKVWNDKGNQDGIRPNSITVQLKVNKGNYGNPVTLTAGADNISQQAELTHTWSNLPKYAAGEPIAYTVEETKIGNVAVTNNMAAGYTSAVTGSMEAGFVITNSHTPEVTSATVKKVWDDADNQDGIRPTEIAVQLYADGTASGSAVTLSEANGWTAKVEKLPKYADGKEIVYTWTEDEEGLPEGYELTDASVTGTVTTLINSYTPEVTSATVKKVWDDANNQDGKRPESLTVTLSNGTNVTLNEGNKWTAKVENLPKYKDGVEIEYTWTEGDMPEGYTLTKTSKEGTITTLTNSYTPAETEVSGTKIWRDNDNEAGKRPSSITVRLYADGSEIDSATVTERTQWSWKFENLPIYANGAEIEYTVTEDKVTGYTPSSSGNNIINTIDQVTFELSGEKFWTDEDGTEIDPPATVASIVVVLYQDGELYKEAKVSAETNWAYTFTGLPRYAVDDDYHVYDYYVKEIPVEGFTPSYDVYTENGKVKVDITNTLGDVEFVNLCGTKVWNDNNDAMQIRPESIQVQLYADSKPYGDAVTLNDANDWSYAFENLPKYVVNDAGTKTEIVYTVKEVDVPEGYLSTVVATAYGFDIVNTLYTAEAGQFAVSKVVTGDKAPADTVPFKFKLKVKAVVENWDAVLATEKLRLDKAWEDANAQRKDAEVSVAEAEKVFRGRAAALTTASGYAFILSEEYTTGSAYAYEFSVVDEYDNVRLGVTTGSTYDFMWKDFARAEDSDSILDRIVAAIKALAERFSSLNNRSAFLSALHETVTTPSAIGFAKEDAEALLKAQRALLDAQALEKSTTEAALKFVEENVTTPSAIKVILTPLDAKSGLQKQVFELDTDDSAYNEEDKTYTVDFELFAKTGYTVQIEATTGAAITYKVTEFLTPETSADYEGTEVTANGQLVAIDAVRTTGDREMNMERADVYVFKNIYDDKDVPPEDPPYNPPYTPPSDPPKPPETPIEEPPVPTGGIEIPPEVLVEIEDPEIPLDAPATGDATDAMPYMAMMLFALAGLVITRRKYN